MSIIIALLVFGLIILVHETGHFVAARRFGILVEEFAIGMGPKLAGIQRGETLYSIRAFPIGGFCRMYGDDADSMASRGGDDEVEDISLRGRALNSKPIPQRIIVMLAGSLMNFLLAFVLFSMLAALTITATTTMRHISPGSPADQAGLAAGDRIVSINGRRIFLWDDIRFEIDSGYGRPIDVGFLRNGERFDITVTPVRIPDQNRYMMGIAPVERVGMFMQPQEGVYRITFFEAVRDGFMRIGFVTRTIMITLVRLVTAPQTVIDQLVGPIGIVGIIDGTYQQVVEIAAEAQVPRSAVVLSLILTMANFGAFISANLGVFNLLPLPALDGGRIVFLTLEAIRRKPIPPEREGMVHLAGLVLLMILAVFIAYQDILRLV